MVADPQAALADPQAALADWVVGQERCCVWQVVGVAEEREEVRGGCLGSCLEGGCSGVKGAWVVWVAVVVDV